MQTTTTPDADYLDKLAGFDFSDPDVTEEPKTEEQKTEELPEATEEQKTALADAMQPLEPLEFEDGDEPISITMGDRPSHKKPLNKIILGMGGAIVVTGALGFMLMAGQKDAERLIAQQSAAPDQAAATSGTILPDDPKDQTIGELRSNEASKKLADEMAKQDAAKAAKDNKPKGLPSTAPVTIARPSSAPNVDYSEPDPYTPPARSYPAPFVQPARSSYTPQYRPSSNYSGPQSKPEKPAVPQKLLAFGALPDEEQSTPTSRAATTKQASSQTAGYQTVSSVQQQPTGFSDSGSIQMQQAAFLTGVAQSRIELGTTAKAEISSGAILPGQFAVRLTEPLGNIAAGTSIVFEPKTVYPNGKVEAYAVGIARGSYQKIVRVSQGAIAVFATNGKILKAKKPSAGFFNSIGGQIIAGGLQSAAARFLSTDSTTTITDSGTQTNTKGGSKSLADIGLSALQGGVNPLMRSLTPQQTTEGKGQFSLEPGDKLLVKVLNPFTF
jgi:hypothetical protein